MLQHLLQKDLLKEMDYQIYLSNEDLVSFANASEQECLGIYYEWEGENVVHLHSRPLKHSFGKTGVCLYTKDIVQDIKIDKDCQFIVCVNKDNNDINVKTFVYANAKYIEVEHHIIPGKEDLYSRSKGLLETDSLSQKHVTIVGLGSFGSQIAIELSKAGIGEFSLFDFDRVELHNIGRHTCTIKDLGRFKTDAIEEAIFGKNPYAKVNKYTVNIVENRSLLESVVQKSDLLICATDNNNSRFLISAVLHKYQKKGIFGRAITRAAGGDVFRYRPGGPCYSCLVGSQIFNANDEEVSSVEAGRRSGLIPAYASSNEISAMVQVGLSIDIEPICNFMLKLSLIELSKGTTSGISSLEEDLQYDAYIWANRRDRNFSHWHAFYKSGAKQTILRWYGINIPKDENCPICSDTPKLDMGLKYGVNLNNDFTGVTINLD